MQFKAIESIAFGKMKRHQQPAYTTRQTCACCMLIDFCNENIRLITAAVQCNSRQLKAMTMLKWRRGNWSLKLLVVMTYFHLWNNARVLMWWRPIFYHHEGGSFLLQSTRIACVCGGALWLVACNGLKTGKRQVAPFHSLSYLLEITSSLAKGGPDWQIANWMHLKCRLNPCEIYL